MPRPVEIRGYDLLDQFLVRCAVAGLAIRLMGCLRRAVPVSRAVSLGWALSFRGPWVVAATDLVHRMHQDGP
jgi:hypothetical protein